MSMNDEKYSSEVLDNPNLTLDSLSLSPAFEEEPGHRFYQIDDIPLHQAAVFRQFNELGFLT